MKKHVWNEDSDDDEPWAKPPPGKKQAISAPSSNSSKPLGFGFQPPSKPQSQPIPPSTTTTTTTASATAADDDEIDPLDAFMVGIDTQVKKDTEESSAKPKPLRRDDFEEEDNIESYINHMKKHGIEVGSGKSRDTREAEDYNSDEEGEQFKELRAGGVEILVATPGRLIDLVKMKATNLRRVSFLVLDEADRMFDLGFEPQVRSICNNVRPDRQTLLFSATFQKRVERLAREVLIEPVRITIGGVGQLNTDVTQSVIILDEDSQKWGWLTARLHQFETDGTVIIFVGKKVGVDELSANLNDHGFKCRSLHGDMQQFERDRVIHDVKHGTVKILVCTDVAARGLDIKSVKTVVNYDVARDIDSHVHRCGRTGRAGEKGVAYTLLTGKDDRFASDLVRNLEDSFQHVGEDLMGLAMKNSWFRKSRMGVGAGNRGRGGARGRGGRGRGRGGFRQQEGGGHGNNPNFQPIGGFEGRSSSGSGGRGGGSGGNDGRKPFAMSFQKASTKEGMSTSFIRK
ncbi:ATP-dependent RNA helicase ddx42 [Blyttiomyces sp. JEL0837]|nr:ATP-dependent RNA helicase ddx42 [Blyttiomyces sp. JEL0837]